MWAGCHSGGMGLDESGWHDLNARLDKLALAPEQREALVEHLLDRLMGHFGADVVECHHGKDDPRRHAMREVAAAAIAHLAPAFEALPEDALRGLIEDGAIGAPMLAPWDPHWRTQPRTAGWRS